MGKFRDRFSRGKTDADWTAWLSDEAPTTEVQAELQTNKHKQSTSVTRPETPRDRIRYAGVKQPVPPPKQPESTSNDKNISINIEIKKPDLPSLESLKTKLPALPYKKIGIGAGSVALVAIIFISFASLKKDPNTTTSTLGSTTEPGTESLPNIPLSFKPMAPKDKPELATTTDKSKAIYDGTRQVYSFTDDYMGSPITVSQQKMPADLEGQENPGQVVGDKIKATQRVNTAFGTAYIATDPKTNTQTIMFAYKDRLVFITSKLKRDPDSWKYYIELLRPT